MEVTEEHPTVNMSHEARRKDRAEKKKKPGSLPLRMFLSMDEEFANPKCVHASNPFHKCGDSCYRRAASLPGKSDYGKKNEDKGVQFKCRHASNPFHSCIDSCRQGLERGSGSGGRNLTDKGRSDKVAAVNETKTGVNPLCIHASNAFHVCSESCFRKIAAKDGVRGVAGIVKHRDDKQSNCSYASNPFHKCTESCNQKISAKNAVRGGVGIAKQGNDNHSKCSYASNPFHTCNEYCVNRKTGRDPVKTEGKQVFKEEKKEVIEMMDKKNLHLKQEDTSNAKTKSVEDSIKQEDTTNAKTKSVEDSIQTAYEPDFLFFLRGVPSSRREQEKNDRRLGVAEKDDVQQKSVSPPILSDEEIAENEQVEILKPVLNPSSPIVFTNFIFVVVYVAHLIVMSAVYSKKSKV